MGQRHQYIIVYPAVFYNDDNCNNRPVRAEVIHHQWLYGRSAIFSLERVLKYISKADKYGRTTDAIASAISIDHDSGYFHRVSIWDKGDWNTMESGGDYGDTGYTTPGQLTPNMFGNNDGCTVIVMPKEESGKPYVCFVTPGHLEGEHWSESEGQGAWTPEQYLEFYYSKADRIAWNKEPEGQGLNEAVNKSLEVISKLSEPLSTDDACSLLPKFKLKKARKKRA